MKAGSKSVAIAVVEATPTIVINSGVEVASAAIADTGVEVASAAKSEMVSGVTVEVCSLFALSEE